MNFLPSEAATERKVQVHAIGQELAAHAGELGPGLDELRLFEQQLIASPPARLWRPHAPPAAES
jgi:hypothetical protein